ncbi:MAG: hypothetical protein C5B54_03595 [Acidobacteria bacterium]|nr:MAG: hypothetical protein C5B54_03595 [Acidobacteriota bacterium]
MIVLRILNSVRSNSVITLETEGIVCDMRVKLAAQDQPNIEVVAIAGSAGAVSAVRCMLSQLPADFPGSIIYVQHMTALRNSVLVDVLQHSCRFEVRWARHNDRLERKTVYLCPAGYSLKIQNDFIRLIPIRTTAEILNSANQFFSSIALAYGRRCLAIVLSGYGNDGAKGVRAISAAGGMVLVEDESSSLTWEMPSAALETGSVDLILSMQNIAPVLVSIVRDRIPLSMVRKSLVKLDRIESFSKTTHNFLLSMLNIVLNRSCTDLGNIQLLQSNNSLVIAAQCGFGTDFLEHFREVSMTDDSACAKALLTKSPTFINDVNHDLSFERHHEIALAAGFRAVQSLPLIASTGKILGVLSTHFRKPQQFTEESVQRFHRQIQYSARNIEMLLSGEYDYAAVIGNISRMV